MELILVMPIVMALLGGLIECSLLWVGNHRVAAAARAGCRAATLPGTGPDEVRYAIAVALGKASLVESHRAGVRWGKHSGDPVIVEVRVPMRAAAPDLFWMVGLGLGDRELVAHGVMRKE